jgi:hypothetical protein
MTAERAQVDRYQYPAAIAARDPQALEHGRAQLAACSVGLAFFMASVRDRS